MESPRDSVPGMASIEALWAAVSASGPRPEEPFDPLLVGDVLQAERAMTQAERRKAFVAAYSWAVPTPLAVDLIVASVRRRSILEVCAGSGLWARLVSSRGVKLVATDGVEPRTPPFYPIEVIDAEAAVLRHRGCQSLLLCWPPYRDDCAFRALRAFEGDRVLYIGDSRFTAESGFHDRLNSSWKLIQEVALPSWPGTSDALRVYGR
jgi:hypothetical protein